MAVSKQLVRLKGSQRSRKTAFDPANALLKISGGRSLEYKKRESLFRQGDSADSVFYILKGQVKLSVVSKTGKEAVIAILNAPSFTGEGCLTGQPIRLFSAEAMAKSSVIKVTKAGMVAALQQQPALSEFLLDYVLRRSIRIEEDLVDQLFNSSEKRLARILLLLANFGKGTEPDAVIAKISQETLAEMVGTTRSRVSLFMNKFRRLGFIKYNGGLEVHSSLLNVILHD